MAGAEVPGAAANVAPEMTRGDAARPDPVAYLRLAGEIAALGAVLLPALGFLIRWMAFGLDPGTSAAFKIALTAPVGELAATGLAATLLAWWIIPVFALTVFFEKRHIHQGKHENPPWAKRPILAVPVGLAILAFALFAPLYPGGGVGAIGGGLVGVYVAAKGFRGDLSLARAWPALVIILLTGAFVAVLSGEVAGLPGGYYQLADGIEGWYYELGGDNELVYLHECGDQGSVVAVPSSEIKHIDYARDAPAMRHSVSGWDMLVHGERPHVGLRFPCPPSNAGGA